MMLNIPLSVTFWLTLYLLATWIFFHWFYHDYRVDVFRQKMFGLRDEWFRFAAPGGIEFKNATYGMTRMTLNGFVRFADRFNLVSAILLARRIRRAPESWRQFEFKLGKSIDRLDEDAQVKVRSIIHRMHEAVIEHLVLSSLVFWVLVVPVVGWLLGAWALHRLRERLAESATWRALKLRWLYPLDDAALTAGQA